MDALVGYIVALTLSMMGVASFVTWAKLGVANVQTAATASQMLVFDKAAQQYVQDNAVQLVSITNSAAAYPVPAAALAPYLPKGFATTNPFGQTWQLQVIQVAGGQLQSLVTSQNGRPIADTKQLAQIAAQAGAQGGFVPYAGQGGDAAMNPASAQGAYGGWSVPLAKFANPGSGHLASLLTFTNAQANNDYLYRVAVPGQATLNQMQTALDMNTNDINSAHNVTATGMSIQNPDGESTLLLGANASISAGDAAQETRTHSNNGLVVANAAGTSYAPLSAGKINSAGDINSTGNVHSDSGISSDHDIAANGLVDGAYLQPNAIESVGAPCGPPGRIANSGTGPLFCENGIWVQGGRPNIFTRIGAPSNTLSIAACAPNESMTGGSCYNIDNCSGNDSSAFGGYPSGNSMICPRSSAALGCDTVTAYAFCAQ